MNRILAHTKLCISGLNIGSLTCPKVRGKGNLDIDVTTGMPRTLFKRAN
jgi:hypothetical protein